METLPQEPVRETEKLTYSAQEVADLLGLDHKTIRRAMERGQIPYIQIGRLKRIPKRAFDRMLDLEEMADALV